VVNPYGRTTENMTQQADEPVEKGNDEKT